MADPHNGPMVVVDDAPHLGWLRLIVEPRRPSVVRRLPRGYLLAVAAVCVGAFMGQLDASIVTLALPSLERSFHSGVAAVSWVGLSYLLVLVATVAAVGRLADMFGRKLLYLYGFAIFILGSALCALAPSLIVLDACRAFQAVGAAMLQANSVAIIALAVPRPRLGRALGVQGAAQALGLALGPSVGGLLLAAGGWRLLFLVNVPVGLIGMVAALLFVPRSLHLQARSKFDWWGFVLFFPAVAAFVYAVSEGGRQGWTSPVIVAALAGSVGLGIGFTGRERRCASPMVDVSLFGRRRFTAGIASSLLAFVAMFGVLVVVPFYLERAHGYGAVQTGFELMAMPVALGLVAPWAGRVADRYGVRLPAVAGLAAVTVGLVALGWLHPPTPGFLALLVVIGAGLGLFMSPNNAGIMAAVPASQSGLASGLLNMARGLGTALGLAVATAVFAARGGDGGAPGAVAGAFTATVVALAGAAGLAAVIVAIGGRSGSSDIGPPSGGWAEVDLALTTGPAVPVELRSGPAPGGERRAPPPGPPPRQ
jgi:EmrB/QacA subfamily drug resistance transporter